jgi:hypothetical protein
MSSGEQLTVSEQLQWIKDGVPRKLYEMLETRMASVFRGAVSELKEFVDSAPNSRHSLAASACDVCGGLLDKPMRAPSCAHVACEACVLRAGVHCGKCGARAPAASWHFDSKRRAQVFALKTHCPLGDCEWLGKRSALQPHVEEDCDFTPMPCLYPGCDACLVRCVYLLHLKGCKFKPRGAKVPEDAPARRDTNNTTAASSSSSVSSSSVASSSPASASNAAAAASSSSSSHSEKQRRKEKREQRRKEKKERKVKSPRHHRSSSAETQGQSRCARACADLVVVGARARHVCAAADARSVGIGASDRRRLSAVAAQRRRFGCRRRRGRHRPLPGAGGGACDDRRRGASRRHVAAACPRGQSPQGAAQRRVQRRHRRAHQAARRPADRRQLARQERHVADGVGVRQRPPRRVSRAAARRRRRLAQLGHWQRAAALPVQVEAGRHWRQLVVDAVVGADVAERWRRNGAPRPPASAKWRGPPA